MATVGPDQLPANPEGATFVAGQQGPLKMSAQELLDAALTCEYLANSGELRNPQAAARRAEHLLELASVREAHEQGVGESSP